MNALLQCRASIIFCLRADEKIEIVRENNRTVVRPLGWMPICEKRFMFEMTASFTLIPSAPGIPQFNLPHKLQRQHRGMFSDQEPISEQSGRMLAEWARGGTPVSSQAGTRATEAAGPSTAPENPQPGPADDIPTAATYHQQWASMIINATRPDQLASTWNGQKDLHKKIAWTDEHPYETLKSKVLAAVASMKAPA